ncbi:MAG: NAD-glutamate dehydrogenase, partial [Gammaproteobacteria bacterium]|nr:NAD-glutamate dehydrogenase [Gammaproteobacteria bacterium]
MVMLRQENEELVSQLLALVEARIEAPSEVLLLFCRHYYANVPAADLAQRNPEDLYTTLLAQWHQMLQRQPQIPALHIYNPTVEDHGWQSPHTVLDLVVEDRPFLVESITMALNRHGLTNHIIFHPVYRLLRSPLGKLVKILDDGSRGEAGIVTEAVIHIEFDRRSDAIELDTLQQKIALVLEDVRAATDDWPRMLADLDDAVLQLEADAAHRFKIPGGELATTFAEAISFLQWLKNHHFVFLGCRDYRLQQQGETLGFQIVTESGKGVLREEIATIPEDPFIPLTPDLCTIINDRNPLIITKATTRSTVHRPVFLDYIGVKRFDAEGKVCGERRFLGLYSSSVYREDPITIPLVARKLERLRRESEAVGGLFSASQLHHVIAEMPRDELFHASAAEVTATALGILQLQDRQRIRLFIRQDLYGCFFSILLYVPRERYTTEIRKRLEKLFLQRLSGLDVNFRVHFSDSILARIRFIVTVPEGRAIAYDSQELEHEVEILFHDWRQELADSLRSHYGEEEGNRLFLRYGDSFTTAYREDYTPRRALPDIEQLERLDLQGARLQFSLFRPPELEEGSL